MKILREDIGGHGDTDEELVIAATAGDDESNAFSALVTRYYGMVYAIAYARLPDRDTAEDAAQEIFIRSYTRLAGLKQPQYFAAWLSRIARNLSIDWARAGRRQSEVLPLLSLEDVGCDITDYSRQNPRIHAQSRQENTRLNHALENLSANEREMVLLHYGEDWTQEEIAHRLRIHRSVSRTMNHALGKMRQMLEPTLRETFRASAPSATASTRIAGAIAALAILPAASRASALTKLGGGSTILLSAAAPASATATAAATTGIARSTGAISILSAAFAAGSKIMAGKGITGIIAVAVIAGSGWYIHRQITPPVPSRDFSAAGSPQHIPNAGGTNGLPPYYVSITPSKSTDPMFSIGDNSFDGKGVDFENAINNSWNLSKALIIYNCGKIIDQKDILIQVPKGNSEILTKVLQFEIPKAYGTTAHMEKRVMDVYVMTLPYGNQKLKPGTGQGNQMRSTGNLIEAKNATLNAIGGFLFSKALKKPVVVDIPDQKSYDIQMDVSRGSTATIQTARDSFGIEFTPAKRLLDVLVLDKV